MINKKKFFSEVREKLFGGKLTVAQVKGMLHILNEWEERKLTDLRWLAYMLATTIHETDKTMQPIEEYGKGKGKLYGKPDPITKKVYFGRGLVQLTWLDNYRKMSKVTGEDLVNHPEKATDMAVAVKIMYEGMIRGMFTGRALRHYFNDKVNNPIEARRIINILDKAELIKGYHNRFLDALT